MGRGRGRGREDGAGGRQVKGSGRGIDDSSTKGAGGGGRGRGGSGGKAGGNRGKLLIFSPNACIVSILFLKFAMKRLQVGFWDCAFNIHLDKLTRYKRILKEIVN